MAHRKTDRLRTVPRVASAQTRIADRLREAPTKAPDYWDFREGAEDLANECLFQYPAMMVPALQKQIIAAILNARPNLKRIADPFMWPTPASSTSSVARHSPLRSTRNSRVQSLTT